MSTQPVFGTIPQVPEYEPYYGLNVLTCFIVTGDYEARGSFDYIAENENKFVLEEVVDITIKDSYKVLINTATVTLPREVLTIIGDKDENGDRERPAFGDTGIFKRGNRIKLFLGYDNNYKVMFDGFIRTIDPKSPFTLHCEDWAYILKNTNVEKSVITKGATTSINKVIKPLIEQSIVSMNGDTVNSNIEISKINIAKNTTVSSVLEAIKRRFGILAFIKTKGGEPTLAMTRSFFSSVDDKSVFDGESATPTIIDFKYNVAKDNLGVLDLDYEKLAIAGVLRNVDGSTYKATVIANTKYDAERSAWEANNTLAVPDEFKIVNEQTLTKKQAKVAYNRAKTTNDYLTAIEGETNTFGLSEYDVRSYNDFLIDKKIFIRNMKDKFKSISKSGIEGTLTIFGDFGIKSATMVELRDHRNPEKNGTYIVETVITKFGVNGYRQTLTLPYRRSKSYNSVE